MQTITLNGLQIHSNTQNIGFEVEMPISGLEYPGLRISPYVRPGEHGAIVPNEFYDGRTIQMTGRIYHPTIATFLQYRRNLQNAMRLIQNSLNIAQPLLLQFTTLDGLNLQTYVYPASPPQFIDRSLNHCKFILQFFAPDPNLYDQSTQQISISIPSGGGVTYPVIYPVTYAAKTGGQATIVNVGDGDTFPVVTFVGPLTSPYIVNQTTGAVFKVNVTLGVGDVLVVDMANKTIVLNGTTNGMQYFDINNTWLSLQPGNNVITIGSALSADTGQAKFSYQNAYIGV